MDVSARVCDILQAIINNNSTDDVTVDIPEDLDESSTEQFKNYLYNAGFTSNNQNKTNTLHLSRRDLDLNRVKRCLTVVQQDMNMKAKSRRNKGDTLSKSDQLEKELASIRAERALKYQESNTQGGSLAVEERRSTRSSMRRIFNFNWFSSLFQSRRGSTPRNRIITDSSYYRSKTPPCCGRRCGL
ncbi:hypothetical protein cand_004940 [Cryptosporidium andersoni]|uniref:Uncharacterized protein n=1 Tax=Cryptosporidium andersoni TaxID=117008 RepID=A0A1J4MLN0_9CRYT|nr:hypothetical protein cand_004940 [Cryptosporidium andersoni]